MDRKETMYDYLATEKGATSHGLQEEMEAILETFEMFDLTPVSGRLTA